MAHVSLKKTFSLHHLILKEIEPINMVTPVSSIPILKNSTKKYDREIKSSKYESMFNFRQAIFSRRKIWLLVNAFVALAIV